MLGLLFAAAIIFIEPNQIKWNGKVIHMIDPRFHHYDVLTKVLGGDLWVDFFSWVVALSLVYSIAIRQETGG